MQKLLLTIALVILAFITKAQTESGTIFVGGNASYFNDKSNTPANGSSTFDRQINIAPTVGIFITPNFSIGVTPQYQYSRDTSFSTGPGYTVGSNSISKLIGAGIELRYYFHMSDKFVFYPALSASYLASPNHKDPYYQQLFVASIRPTFAYFVTHRLAVNAIFGNIMWEHQRLQEKSSNAVTDAHIFNLSANNDLGLGLTYYFAKS